MLQWWIYVITYLSKPIECTSRVNPKVNYELWVIMMCQYRFINCNKSTTLVGNDESGGGYACVEAGAIWKICAFLSKCLWTGAGPCPFEPLPCFCLGPLQILWSVLSLPINFSFTTLTKKFCEPTITLKIIKSFKKKTTHRMEENHLQSICLMNSYNSTTKWQTAQLKYRQKT